jgi:hypothetical protein
MKKFKLRLSITITIMLRPIIIYIIIMPSLLKRFQLVAMTMLSLNLKRKKLVKVSPTKAMMKNSNRRMMINQRSNENIANNLPVFSHFER